jgi:hypothetical protein
MDICSDKGKVVSIIGIGVELQYIPSTWKRIGVSVFWFHYVILELPSAIDHCIEWWMRGLLVSNRTAPIKV